MIVNTGLKRSNGSLVGRLFRQASFAAPLTTSLLPSKSAGSPTPTFSRATTATVMGYAAAANSGAAQVLLTCASGEARFAGARRISQDNWSTYYADGTPIAPTTLLGYFSEPAATQLIATTADIRDMTTASWTLGATMTRALTSTGIDGAANSATRLTGGVTSTTNRISYSYVAAAVNRTYSCYIKRITGTGPVLMTMDNWATSTDISSQLVTGTWVQVSYTQNNLNPIVGLQISTNGDALDVDCNQIEASAYPTSPILTGGATRNTDSLTYVDTANASVALGTYYTELRKYAASGISDPFLSFSGLGAGYLLANSSAMNANANLIAWDGTTSPSVNAVTLNTLSHKYSHAWGSNQQPVIDGIAGTPVAFDGSMGTTGNITVGSQGGGSGGYMKNLYFWTKQLTPAQQQAITT